MLGGFGSSLILNTVVIYPVTRQILGATKRFPNLTHRKLLAIAFLSLVGILSVAVDLYDVLQNRNLFKIMQVPRTASDKDIRQAYQRLARDLHPDQNRNDPDAQAKFVEMKEAYDVLANPQMRDAYDKWGYDGLKWMEGNEDIMASGMLQLGVNYVIWFALTVLITVSSSHTHSRTISLAGLALLLAFDLNMRTGSFPFAIPFVSHLAVYQMSKLLFTLYPTYIGGAVVMQNMLYLDPAERNLKILAIVSEQQRAIRTNLTNLENELRLTHKVGALPTGGGVGSTAAAASVSGSNLPRHLQAKNAKAGEGGNQPKQKRGIPSWLFMIGFYVLFNYVLK